MIWTAFEIAINIFQGFLFLMFVKQSFTYEKNHPAADGLLVTSCAGLFTLLLFYTTLSDEPFRINAKLTDIQSSLPDNLFVLCHRSYIINIAHVRMLTRTECTLSNDMSIPISRTYTAEVEQAFDRYHQGGHVKYDLDGV